MKKLILFSALFLVACANNTQTATKETETTTIETAKTLTVKEVFDKQKEVIRTVDNFKMTHDISVVNDTDQTKKITSLQSTKIVNTPTLLIELDINSYALDTNIQVKQYFNEEYFYTINNNTVSKHSLKQANIDITDIKERNNIFTKEIFAMLENGTVSTSSNTITITADETNINKDAVISYFTSMTSRNINNLTNIYAEKSDITKFKFIATIDKEKLYTKSVTLEFSIKISENDKEDTLTFTNKSTIEDINNTKIELPENIKNAQ